MGPPVGGGKFDNEPAKGNDLSFHQHVPCIFLTVGRKCPDIGSRRRTDRPAAWWCHLTEVGRTSEDNYPGES